MNVFDLSAKLMLDKSEFDQGLSGAVSSLAVLGDAFVKAGKFVVDQTNATAEYGDHVDKMSQKIGISTEAYQKWDYVMSLCGTSVDNLQTGMKTLSSVIYDASNGTESANEKLSALGLSIEDLNGLSQEDQLQLVVERLQGMEAGADRTAIAVDLLGKSATELAPLLNMTSEEMQSAMEEADAYGMVMSEDLVKASAQFEDSLTKLNGTVEGVRNKLTGNLLPSFTMIVDGFSMLIVGEEDAETKLNNGFNSLVNNLGNIIPKVTTMLTTLATAFVNNAPTIISKFANALLTNLPTIVTTLATAMPEVVLSLADAILENLPLLLDAGMQSIAIFIDGFASGISEGSTISNIVTCIADLVDVLLDNLDLIIDAGINLMLALSDGLIEALPVLLEKMPEIIQKLTEAYIENTPKLVMATIQIMVAIASAVLENIPLILETVVACIGEIISTIIEKAPEVANSAKEWFEQMKASIAEKWDDVVSKFKNLFDEWITNIKEFYKPLVDAVKDWFAKAKDGIEEKWNEIKEAVPDWVTDFIDKFMEKVGDIKQIGIDFVASLLAGLEEAWNTVLDWGKSAVEGIKDMFKIDVGGDITVTTPTTPNKQSNSDAFSRNYSTEPMSVSTSANNSLYSDRQIELMEQQNSLLMQIASKDTVIKTDSLFDAMQSASESYNMTTGLSAFA